MNWARSGLRGWPNSIGFMIRQTWRFTKDQVIAYRRSCLKAGVPTWKRLKIVQGLILYGNRALRSQEPNLEGIRAALQRLAVAERQMRIALRNAGKGPNTAKAYGSCAVALS